MSEKISVKKWKQTGRKKKWKESGQDFYEVEICKIDEIQRYFNEHVTNLYLLYTYKLALFWKRMQVQSPFSSQTPKASFENSTHLWKLF